MKVGNVITIALIAACGVLGLLAALYGSGWSNDVGPLDPTAPRPLKIDNLGGGAVFDLGDIEDYREIGERPLFADNRQPAPVEEAPIDNPVEDKQVAELDVAIGGIIINGDTKIALLTDNSSNTPMRVREGANLEGELADWVLTAVEPRKLSFDGGSAGQVDLELQVNEQKIAAPAKPVNAASERDQAAPAGAENNDDEAARAARAEEIRRRVAERREQLREEAARRRAERQEQDNDG